jgi:hypothetical protein
MDEPAASKGISAILPKAEANSERSRFAIRCDNLAAITMPVAIALAAWF